MKCEECNAIIYEDLEELASRSWAVLGRQCKETGKYECAGCHFKHFNVRNFAEQIMKLNSDVFKRLSE